METSPDDERGIAEDFRRQLQERFPVYEGDRDEGDVSQWIQDRDDLLQEIVRVSFSNKTQTQLVDKLRAELAATPLVNPRDEPFTHNIIQGQCKKIEQACRELEIPLHSGVAFGVAPTFELEAARHPIPLTSASVVTLSFGLITFCSHLSKVMSMSLVHESDDNGVKISNQPSLVLSKIDDDLELKKNWMELFGGYAYGSGPLNVEYRVVPYPQSITRALLLSAMEQFAVAHEYAHHIARHGGSESATAELDPESRKEEIEADLFSLGISRYLEGKSEAPNFYAASGVGAVLLLKSLDYVRRARKIFLTGDDDEKRVGTHPTTQERLREFDSFDESLGGSNEKLFKQMRDDICCIVDLLWYKLRPLYVLMHQNGLRPEKGSESWLPK